MREFVTGSIIIILYAVISISIIVPIEMNSQQKIKNEGYQAALNEMPPTACPYENSYSSEKIDWMNGWQKGFMEIKQKNK